ncbi:MAG: alpha-L-fucosidase [Planctomycetota bacterium]
MKKTSRLFLISCMVFVFIAANGCSTSVVKNNETYEPNWISLSKHKVPEWFRDAKFGIYTHWGPVTVGAEDGPGGVQWYGYNMYRKESPTFEYHRKKYGDQNEVGYKDMVRMFAAEKFDAEAWAELFAAAGAKFAGPVAIHHDNYAMWDSKYTEWDSMDQKPGRDFTAELEKAIRKRGMKFIATFHHAFAWRYFEPSYKFDGADPKYGGLYCQAHEPGADPTPEFLDQWLGKVNEVVEKYEPDMTWFDFGLGNEKRNCITEEYRLRMFADYYNWALRNNRQVGVAHKHHDIHEHTGILDFERGREDRLTPYPWLTDTSVGPWFHQKSHPFKTTNDLVDVLVDIVSKNGCMLLNVGPAADGTIPQEAQKLLLEIGAWLEVNGEAIYETRPCKVFGEGPTRNTGGGFSERKDKPYTSEDIRFTQSKDGKTLYVIALDWPEEKLTIESLKIVNTRSSARIRLLGHKGDISYNINNEKKLVIRIPGLSPAARPCEHAFAFKLTGFEIDLHKTE